MLYARSEVGKAGLDLSIDRLRSRTTLFPVYLTAFQLWVYLQGSVSAHIALPRNLGYFTAGHNLVKVLCITVVRT